MVEAARREGKALEINNASYVYTRKGSRENDLLIMEAARREGIWISAGSDALSLSLQENFVRGRNIRQTSGWSLNG